MGRVLHISRELAEALQPWGVREVDIRPKKLPYVYIPNTLEVFVADAPASAEICQAIAKLTGLATEPSAADSAEAFRREIGHSLMHHRLALEDWEDWLLPCFILGVDFDRGRARDFRPAQPELWRLVDHQVDAHNAGRRILQAMILEATPKGLKLLGELIARFDNWFGGAGCNGRPPLNAVLDYRAVLNRYDVDCNEAFREGLVEGWFPIDLQEDRDIQRMRELIATELPEQLGDLLLDEDGKPVTRYGAHFCFVAVTG
jgi:hypothetical protein